jgi:hypothetical protein
VALPPPSVPSTPVTVMVIEHAPSVLPSATVCFPSHGGPMQLHTQIPVTQQQHCQSHYKSVIPHLYLFQLMYLFNTTLIQCQLLKHLKITPTCFHH